MPFLLNKLKTFISTDIYQNIPQMTVFKFEKTILIHLGTSIKNFKAGLDRRRASLKEIKVCI